MPGRRSGAWAPMASPAFRRLWLAQFTSNVGSWIQTVGAQWVMLSLTSSAVLLTAVSAASSLAVLLLAIPAGALGDLVDRRRLLLGSQAAMLVAAVLLAVFAALGWLTPALLLGLLVAIGVGSVASAPTWQTLQPELVPVEDRPQAIALGSVNQNLARAVGPAVGGALLAATSAAVTFGVNAASFVGVIAAIALTRLPARASALPREHAVAAVRAGGRFVLHQPELLALIARAFLYVFFAGAIWALLPLLAHRRLDLGAPGYGVLLGCVGIGAVAAAAFGPGLRARMPAKRLYALACLSIAAGATGLGLTRSPWIAAVLLVLAGGAWIVGIGLLGAAYQGQLPSWVKARGMAFYLVGFQGGIALGALALGAVAQASDVSTALWVTAAGLVAAGLLTGRLPLPDGAVDGAALAEPLPLPDVPVPDVDRPVRVEVEYRVRPDAVDAFLACTPELRRLRRRTGAVRWRLFRDADDPTLLRESFDVGSWTEHERQHQRLQQRDLDLLHRLDASLEDGTARRATHGLAVAG